MAETAAHLIDHVFSPLPVRQRVLAVPKRLRYFLQRDTALQGTVPRIFLSVVEHCLREHGPACPPPPLGSGRPHSSTVSPQA